MGTAITEHDAGHDDIMVFMQQLTLLICLGDFSSKVFVMHVHCNSENKSECHMGRQIKGTLSL